MTAATASSQLWPPLTEFVIPVLATWRLSYLLWAEDGPLDFASRIRRWSAARNVKLFDCFYCLSLWVALPAALVIAASFTAFWLDWLAFSGAAILLERMTAPATPPPAVWRETMPDDLAE